MLTLETPADLATRAGQLLGTSDWLAVPQADIDTFARLTGDAQWIHVDVERARAYMPDGKTIAHGFLLLSLLPGMFRTIYEVRKRRQAINYGLNKVRFLTPVQADSRIRLQTGLLTADAIEGGFRFTFEQTVEIEGGIRPALVAETIVAIYS